MPNQDRSREELDDAIQSERNQGDAARADSGLQADGHFEKVQLSPTHTKTSALRRRAFRVAGARPATGPGLRERIKASRTARPAHAKNIGMEPNHPTWDRTLPRQPFSTRRGLRPVRR